VAAVVKAAVSTQHSLRTHPEHKVRMAQIQHELDAIWEDGHQALAEGQVVTRACMSNLLIYCDDDDQCRDVAAAVPAIVQSHPSRVVLLTGRGKTSEPGIEVFVSGHYSVLSSGWQVCAEQIRVVADDSAAPRLPSVARAQIVGDLPTALWWASRQPPPFAGKLFYPLATISDQIIYDSYAWKNPVRGQQAMSRWVATERTEYVIDNLAWRRLKQWRSLISQVLDPAVHAEALSRVTRLEIEHGPHAVAMTSLLVGWLAALLGWRVKGGKVTAGKETVWQFSAGERGFTVRLKRVDHGPSAPQQVHWSWGRAGCEQHVTMRDLGDGRLGIIDGEHGTPSRVISAIQPDLSMLVSAQLAHRARDRVFELALETANSMTSVLL
jgi:glucose-6-phosphate dehydrogenase assembly protein OpcA